MSAATPKTVTLTKRCELHTMDLPRQGALIDSFRQVFPTAFYNDEAGEWHMVWKRGTYAESNARLENFFADHGVEVVHVNKC
jgi:hypothetical protein